MDEGEEEGAGLTSEEIEALSQRMFPHLNCNDDIIMAL